MSKSWGEFTKTTGLGAVLCHRAFTAPKSESQIRRYRAEAALNGPVTARRASFTRQFRAVRVRHASIRPNLSQDRAERTWAAAVQVEGAFAAHFA